MASCHKVLALLCAGVSSLSLVRKEVNVGADGIISGVGNDYGYGSILGSGFGNAYGLGYGPGYGSGSHQYNYGYGSGSSHVYGSGSSYGYGYGYGYGSGSGSSYGEGKGKGTGKGKGKGGGKGFSLQPGSGCSTGVSRVLCTFRVNANVTHIYYDNTDLLAKPSDPSSFLDAEHPPSGTVWMADLDDKPQAFRKGGEGKTIGVFFEEVPGAVLAIGAYANSSGKSGSDTCDDSALMMLCFSERDCSKWHFWKASTTSVRSFGHPEKSGNKPHSSLSPSRDDPAPGISEQWYKRDFDDKAWKNPCESKSNLTLVHEMELPPILRPPRIWGANRFSYFRVKN